jgi:hypothetical protein
MKRKTLHLTIFVLTFSLLSCKPDYISDPVKSWLVCNQKVKEIQFLSNLGNVELLKVDYKSRLESPVGFNEKESIYITFSDLHKNQLLQIHSSVELANEIQFSVGHSIYIDALGKIEKFSGLQGTIDILPLIDINGTQYEDAYRYSFSEQIDNLQFFHEFIYSKKTGLIRYTLGNEVWTRSPV